MMWRSQADRLTPAEIKALLAEAGSLPTTPGVSVRVSHTDCPAGSDNRDRVYITAETKSRLLLFCHNCQRGGSWNTKAGPNNYRITALEQSTKLTRARILRLWEHAKPVTSGSKEWGWLAGYGLQQATINEQDLRYSDDLARLLLPVWNGGGFLHASSLWGFQARSLDAERLPKYVTYKLADNLIRRIDGIGGPNPFVVVCEDMVSALKVTQAGYAAIPVLCSTPKAEHVLAALLLGFPTVVVWYDNDNPEVIKHARALADSLRLAGVGYVRVVPPPWRDPKRHSHAEIKAIVEGKM